MKELNDELLNKYIDGDLSHGEITEMYDIIKNDADSLNRLKAHKLVDRILKDMEIYEAPSGFTEKLMNKIAGSLSGSRADHRFFKGILMGFTVMIAATLGYMISLTSGSGATSSDQEIAILDRAYEIFNSINIDLTSIFQNNIILYIGIFLTVVLLLTGIFLVDSHKQFKQKLQDF